MKRAVFIAALGVAGAGALVASELIDSLRFGQAFKRGFAASESDAGPWPQALQACFFCHGPLGQARSRDYPALAGLPAPYIEAQLRAFATGQRSSPTMGPLARQLTDPQMQTMAAYFARQAPVRNEAPAEDATFAARGQAVLKARTCQACHGERLGGQGAVPRLAGQAEAYLAHELAVFQTGARRDPTGAMNTIAAALPTHDIPAVAHYLATLSPTSPTPTAPR
jgi:cytochrome c553